MGCTIHLSPAFLSFSHSFLERIYRLFTSVVESTPKGFVVTVLMFLFSNGIKIALFVCLLVPFLESSVLVHNMFVPFFGEFSFSS